MPSSRTPRRAATKAKSSPKGARKTKDHSQNIDGEEQPAATSSYFVSDAPNDSDSGKKKRKVATRSSASKPSPQKKRKTMEEEDENEYGASGGSDEEPAPKVYDSDALDDDLSDAPAKGSSKKVAAAKRIPNKKSQSPRKKRKQEESEEYDDLEEGQEVVGVVVQAPTTGRVPPGQISQNTLNFLAKLQDPACNDREWFKLHEPVYRLAEKEWKDFIEAFTDVLVEVDPQIPQLPPKDVIHRIYRDIRFSNDKTPYKRGFSASFSRSGRKGIFAGYHVMIKPGNESMIAGGTWCPGRNELATIRSNIQRNSRRLRDAISAPDFVKFFGKAERDPNGARQNIFGMEDELKVAPKGVAKDDKDIDLLKCRSFAVSHKFLDSEVLAPDFTEKLAVVARVMQPFVYCLNDMMTITDHGGSGDEGEEEEA